MRSPSGTEPGGEPAVRPGCGRRALRSPSLPPAVGCVPTELARAADNLPDPVESTISCEFSSGGTSRPAVL